MQRVIYEVYAKVVDENGSYNTLSSDTFDSMSYSGDLEKTRVRAEGRFHEIIGAMCKNDTRQVQSVIMMDCYGSVLLQRSVGQLADVAEGAEE